MIVRGGRSRGRGCCAVASGLFILQLAAKALLLLFLSPTQLTSAPILRGFFHLVYCARARACIKYEECALHLELSISSSVPVDFVREFEIISFATLRYE